MQSYVWLIATMDTKAQEARYLRTELMSRGLKVKLIDTGILKESPDDVDITQKDVLCLLYTSSYNSSFLLIRLKSR